MQILLSDIDGTLIRSNLVSKDLNSRILRFRANNMLILATGRSCNSVYEARFKHDLPKFDYAICSNGSVIIDSSFNKIYTSVLKNDDFINLMDRVNCSILNRIIIATTDNTYTLFQKNNGIKKENLLKLSGVCAVTLELNTNLKSSVNLIRGLPLSTEVNGNFIDIVNMNITKWSGFETLVKKIGLSKLTYETIAIGDDYNDLSILNNADQAYTFDDSAIKENFCESQIVSNYIDIFSKI